MTKVTGYSNNSFDGVERKKRTDSTSTVVNDKNETKTTKKDGVSFSSPSDKGNISSNISFLGDESNAISLSPLEAFENFESKIANQLKKQKIPPRAVSSIYQKYSILKDLVNTNQIKTVEDFQKFNGLLASYLQELNTYGLLKGSNSEINNIVKSSLNKIAQNFSLELEMKEINGKILSFNSKSENLSQTQTDFMKAASELITKSEMIQIYQGKTSSDKFLLMALREELIRRGVDSVSIEPSKSIEKPTETDMEVIANTVELIDNLISDSNKIPPNLINDLQKIVSNIVNSANSSLSEGLKADIPSQVDLSNLPQMPLDQLNADTSATSNINAPDNSNSPNTAPLSDLSNQLISTIKNAPYDIGKEITGIIQSYSTAMNAVESTLPPFLPFPITLFSPMSYEDDSGNKFVIPAGSTLSQRGSGFEIDAPSLLMQTDGTTVNAGQTNIKLGNNLDRLNIETLTVATDDTTTNIDGFTAQIDRTNNTSLIRADSANIDLTNGNVSLTNAVISQAADGSVGISTDTFNYSNDGTDVSFTDFQLNNTYDENSSTLSGQANTVDLTFDGNQVKADNLSFNLTETNDGSNMGNISVENLNYVFENGTVNAENATVNIISNPDGSSALTFTTQNAEILTKDGNITTTGNTIINLTQDENGNITNLNVEVEDTLTFQDENGILNAKDGNLNVNFNENGKIQDISGNASELNFESETQKINAEGANFNATYGENGLLENLNASADKFSYEGDEGNLNVGKGNLDVKFNENGKLESLNATSNIVNWTGKDGEEVLAKNTTLDLGFDENGNLSSLNSTVGDLKYTGKNGENIDVTNGTADIKFDENGNITNLTGSADNLDYLGKNGESLNIKGLDINLEKDENGFTNLGVTTGELNYLSEKGEKIDIKNGSVDLTTDENGNILNATASAAHFSFEGTDGEKITAQGTGIEYLTNEDGSKSLNVEVGKANYLGSNGESLEVLNGDLNINTDEEGNILDATANAGQVLYNSKDGETVKANGLNINFTNNLEDGTKNLNIETGKLEYTGKNGENLNITNGNVNITTNEDGYITNALASADKLEYTGKNGDIANIEGLNINITGDENGISNIGVEAGKIDYTSTKGEILNVTNGAVSITRDAEGFISNATGHADSLSLTGTNGETVNANGLDINLNLGKDGFEGEYDITASVENLEANIPDESLTVNASNIVASMTDKQINFHVDSAEIIQDLEKKLNVKVENVDFVINKNDDGGIKDADLQLEGLEATIDEMNIMVVTQDGERVRLNVQMDETGESITEAFLQIPEGGEVKISKENMDVTLGEQLITFTINDGVYTLRDEGIDILYETKDSKIKVEGGTAQVSLDSNTGNIIIDEITGTNINAEIGENTIDIDIKEMENFIVKATELSGSVQGAYIELQPGDDNSTMTATINATISGKKVSIEIDDAHQLKALGYIATNEARVYIGDESGQGNLTIKSGPLKLYGREIEISAKYNTFDGQKMLSSISRLNSRDGISKGALTLEPDGVVRIEKQSTGLYLGASVLLPRAWESDYNFTANQPDKDNSWGAVLSIGGKGKSRSGNEYTGTVFGGLVPGSYISIDQTKGSATLYNVPLPSHIAIPTTAIGGVTFSKEGENSSVDFTMGGFANAAGFIPSDSGIPIEDQMQYGGFAGISYRTDDYRISADGMVGVKKDKTIDHGVRVGLGYRWRNSPKKEEETSEPPKSE